MSAPKFRIVATQPFTQTHGDFAGKPMTDLVAAQTSDRSDAEVIAQALRAAGWRVEIRMWTRRQHRDTDSRGRACWRAGYVEYRA